MRNAGFVFHGDSTTRNMQGPLQELLRFAAAPDVAAAARYYADKVVAATRAAVAKAMTEGSKNKTRHSLRLIYPGTADDKGSTVPAGYGQHAAAPTTSPTISAPPSSPSSSSS